jgi:hypothetical protein
LEPRALAAIAGQPFLTPNPTYDGVAAQYIGTPLPLLGLVTITSDEESIYASLDNADGWEQRSLQLLPQGAALGFGGLFRNVVGGQLVQEHERGRIVSEDGTWSAEQATFYGQTSRMGRTENYNTYRFKVGEIVVHGPAFGEAVAATRDIYAGAEWSAGGELEGSLFFVSPLSSEAKRRKDERIAVAYIGELDHTASEAMWLLLSFVAGNRVHALARERYTAAGALIEVTHHRGTGIGAGRDAPFRPFYTNVAPDGFTVMGTNIARLLRAKFPIDIVFEHLHMATSGNIDVDAQHFILAIHCAFEAWNRKLGLLEWVDDDCWGWFIGKARRHLLSPIYETIGPEMKANVASALRHANRTTTAWRQSEFFRALQIDTSAPDAQRALDARDEILHNGCFLERWEDLTPEKRQERFSDVQRLRKIVLTIIFRLTSYEGQFIDPVTYQNGNITRVPLPEALFKVSVPAP